MKLTSDELRARAAGKPFDPKRVKAFVSLAEFLESQAPDAMPAMTEDTERRTLLPFYESYFSNYIEGTEFTLDEAAEIVFDHVVPEQRPQDAHDIIGTYELTSSVEEMRRTPKTADEMIDLMKARQAVIMAGRRGDLASSRSGRTVPAPLSSWCPTWSRERCDAGSRSAPAS